MSGLTRGGALRFLVGAGVVAAALVVGEMAARTALPDIDPTRQIRFEAGRGDAPTLGPRDVTLRQVKNTGDFNVAVRFNRHGFRDAGDVALSGPRDIVLVGDSFMLGWGVEEEERTSNRLAAVTGRTVYNISIPTDLDGFEKLLEHARSLGGRFGHVVVGLTMEMGLRVYGPQATPALAPAATPKTDNGSRLYRLKVWLRDNSTLYFALTRQVHEAPALAGIAVRLGLVTPNLEGIHHRAFSAEVVESTADRLATLASRYDTLALIVPSRALWHGADTGEEEKRHAALVAALVARGIEAVDMRPAMESSGRPLAYHFANDGHWRPSGHDLAARLLADRVRRRWGGGNEPTP
ncbi:MAG: hypothetical protein H7840_07290 [Alphaproteobacteria bacterium]